MGEVRQRQSATKRFLEKHPICCLCGGSVPATTIEHAPPKVLFINKHLPANDHLVPACERCNNGSGDQDQIAALYAMVSAYQSDIPIDYFNRLVDGVRKHSPEAFRAISGGTSQSQSLLLRVNGLFREMEEVRIKPILFRNWLNPWAAKQAYALHYLNTREIIPSTAQVFVHWFSNAAIINGRVPDHLIQILPNFGALRQGRKSSAGQFSYKWCAGRRGAGYVLFLQDSCLVVASVLRDVQSATQFGWAKLFVTSAERGIHAVSEAQQ